MGKIGAAIAAAGGVFNRVWDKRETEKPIRDQKGFEDAVKKRNPKRARKHIDDLLRRESSGDRKPPGDS